MEIGFRKKKSCSQYWNVYPGSTINASMPSLASAFARLSRRVTNSETGSGETSFMNGRPVERKLFMEQDWKAVSESVVELLCGEGRPRRGCCGSCWRTD